MILVDTSVWVDFFNGNESNKTEQLEHFLSSTVIVVGDLILAELLQGFRNDKDYQIAKSLLQECSLVQLCDIDLAIKSARTTGYSGNRELRSEKLLTALLQPTALKIEYLCFFRSRF